MTRREIQTVIKMFMVLAAGIVLGAFLLCLAFLLPDEPIRSHVRDSAYVFEAEGEYPAMDSGLAKIMDNWTDSLMLSSASFRKEGAGILEKAMGVYRPQYPGSSPMVSLICYCQGEEGFGITSYARYWHGYLIFLRPLLCIADYEGFRSVNSVMVYVVMAMTFLLMARRKRLHLAPAYILSVLFLRLDAVGFSLQYSSVYYVVSAAVFAGIALESWLKKHQWVPFYFLLIGMVTSYVDLLTYPLVTLGVPLALWMALDGKGSWKARLKEVVVHSMEWLFGYAGMWMGKWCLASVVLGRDVLVDAFGAARSRVSKDYVGRGSSRPDVILRNMEFGASGIWVAIAVVSLVLILCLLLRLYRNRRRMSAYFLPFLMICLMPFVWYAALGNHSIIHTWFTYRNLAVTVCAAVCMGSSPEGW